MDLGFSVPKTSVPGPIALQWGDTMSQTQAMCFEILPTSYGWRFSEYIWTAIWRQSRILYSKLAISCLGMLLAAQLYLGICVLRCIEEARIEILI